MSTLRFLLHALLLCFGIVPGRPAPRVGPERWFALLLLAAALLALESWFASESPRGIDPNALRGLAWAGLATVAAAYVAARWLDRPALFWPLAALLLGTQIVIEALLRALDAGVLGPWLQDADLQDRAWDALWVALSLLALRRGLDWLEPWRRWPTRSLAALGVTAGFLLATGGMPIPALFYTADFAVDDDIEAVQAVQPTFDPETVMAAQHPLLARALEGLAPQRPGVIDLYVLAFAGDGGESVFRNEVEYAERLFAERFGAAGRTLVLVNHPQTVRTRPLATLANLRAGLRGIGEVIDPDEDLLLLFLTTHGTENHELYVALDPLPLNQIRPDDLAQAIRDAGIGWRAVVVSACYAGGFLPALQDERALLIAAARRDRASFGCGVHSELSWFGRAFLVEGLNATGELDRAFAAAARSIRTWEAEQELPRSHPQIDLNAAVLARWRARIEAEPPGAPIAFAPASGTAAAPGNGAISPATSTSH